MEKTINFANTVEGKAQSKKLVDCRLKLGCATAKDFYDKFNNGIFSYSQYQKYESGERLLSKKAAMLYANIFNVDWEWLKGNVQQIKEIYRIGFVEAGVWTEAAELPRDEWQAVNYAMNDSLKGRNVFALGVRGNSMNKIFPPEKTTLICLSIEDYYDLNPDGVQNGDYVIAQRVSADGKYEATVKRYNKLDDGTIILEAMSTDPRYINIIVGGESCEYKIIAVVIDFQTKLKDL